jgi:hypothetical protein
MGLIPVEPVRLQRPQVLQSVIDAPEAFVQHCAEQFPGTRRFLRASLGQHLHTGFYQNRVPPGCTLPFSINR